MPAPRVFTKGQPSCCGAPLRLSDAQARHPPPPFRHAVQHAGWRQPAGHPGPHHAGRLQSALRPVPLQRAAGQDLFRECRLAPDATAGQRAHHLLRPARERGGREAARPVQHRQSGRRRLGRGEAVLRAAAGRAPAARTGRVLLQYRQHPAAAAPVSPQRLHLRAAGGLHRAPGRHTALIPGLLPGEPPLEGGPAPGPHRHGAGLRLPGHRG